MAQNYQAGGASCLSVLTDVPHFGGSVEDLQTARNACTLPVIRKDFTVDARDVCDARIMGADCVLLIAAALSTVELGEFLALARRIDIDALVEVHDEAELAVALDAGATLIGVNQRDLVTFNVDQERAVRMGSLIPSHLVKVAESGVRGREDALALRSAGYDAVLVGEHLVTSANPSQALTDLCVD
jgi:indole-3-glycerol phosphate synthase